MRFYVYELVDPRDGSVFYVGKGQGDRAAEHLRETMRAEIPSGAKQERIAAIVALGLRPLIHIADRFDDEHEALDAEADRIARYGIENLTNICRRGVPSSDALNEAFEIGYKLRAEAIVMLGRDAGEEARRFWRESVEVAEALIERCKVVHGCAHT